MEIQTSPIPFALQKSDGRSRVSSQEDLVNMYVEAQGQTAESPYAVIMAPGLRLRTEIPNVNGILGAIVARDQPYVMTSEGLYKITDAGYSRLASHTLYGRTVAAFNGEWIVYVDGQSMYGYNVISKAFQKIDVDPCWTVIYQDGYFLANKKDTNEFIVSDLDSIVFNPLQFASAEADPDNILAMISDHREVYIFGTKTCELWFNSGAAVPFDPLQGAFMEKGAVNPWCVTKANNTVYFVGHDRRVYQTQGSQPLPISSFSIEERLQGADMSEAFMTTYTEEGHIFIWLTIPSIKATYVFDASNGLWQTRSSITDGRHRASHILYLNGQNIVTDYRTGKIFTFDLSYPYDDVDYIERIATLPPIFGQGNRMINRVFELKAQNFGNELTVPAGVSTGVWTMDSQCIRFDSSESTMDGYAPATLLSSKTRFPSADVQPQIALRFTDNHGSTWNKWMYKPAALKGEQNIRWRWYRLGSFYERTYQIKLVAPIPCIWTGAYIG